MKSTATKEGRYTVEITVTLEASSVSAVYREVTRAMAVACSRSDLIYVDCEYVEFSPYCASTLCASCQKLRTV